MLEGAPPPGCELPTGLGRTSVIPLWVIAFAFQAVEQAAARHPK